MSLVTWYLYTPTQLLDINLISQLAAYFLDTTLICMRKDDFIINGLLVKTHLSC